STSVTTEGVDGVVRFINLSFQEHISNNPPQKVLSVDEFLTQRREVLQLLKQYDTEEAAPGEDVDAPPGEEPEEQPSSKTDEETTALRERIISLRRKIHKATTTAVADRWNFEEGGEGKYQCQRNDKLIGGKRGLYSHTGGNNKNVENRIERLVILTYVVLSDSSQLTSDGFEKLPDQIMYPYAEPYDLQKTCL
ncbi:unnamed protein product, partial [Timema podura]|nr:unnamed protein product [Timema podura]